MPQVSSQDVPLEPGLSQQKRRKPRPLQPSLRFQRRPSFQTPAEVYRIPLPPIFDGWHVRIGRAAAGRWRGGSLRGVQVRAVTGRGGSRQEGCSARLLASMIASAHNSRCDKKSAHDSPHGSWQCIICARLSHGRCSTASSGAHLQQTQPFICRAMRVFSFCQYTS